MQRGKHGGDHSALYKSGESPLYTIGISTVSNRPRLKSLHVEKLQLYSKPKSKKMVEMQAAPGFKNKFLSKLQLPQKSVHSKYLRVLASSSGLMK